MAVDEDTPDSPRSRIASVGKALSAAGTTLASAWRADPRMLVASVATSVLLAFLPAAQVVAVGWLTRTVIAGHASMLALVVLAGTVGLGQISGEIGYLVQDRLARRVQEDQQNALTAAVGRLPPQQLATAEVNANMQACRGALSDLSYASIATMNALRGLVAALLLCIAVWQVSPAAGALVTAALIPMLVVDSWVAGLQDKLWTTLGEAQRRRDYALEQLIYQRSATELGTLGSSHHMAELVSHNQRRLRGMWDKHLRTSFRGNILGALVTATLLGLALWSVLQTSNGPAGVAAGVVAVLAGMSATSAAGYSVGMLINVAPKATRYQEFLASAPAAEPQHVIHDTRRLEAHGITVTYPGADEPALVDASITAERGQMIALVGVNGAGKTTLVNALLGIIDRDAGTVSIDGIDADTMTPAQRLSHFGLLTQEFGRYELTVRQALMLGTPEAAADVTDERLWQALAAARIDDVIRKLPDGLDAQLGQQWEGVGLSGGQWQRIALARIHLRDAGIWVLDEPTSAIDAEAEAQIFDELHRTRADRIAIVVSHRAWTLRKMDRIHVFDHGRIVESGSYADLLEAGGRFAEIFREQA